MMPDKLYTKLRESTELELSVTVQSTIFHTTVIICCSWRYRWVFYQLSQLQHHECGVQQYCGVVRMHLWGRIHRSPRARESKTVLDSRSLVLDSGFQVPNSSLCQWNLIDSRLRSLVGLRNPWAVFRITKAKISWIPESGFPDMGRYRRWKDAPWRVIFV